MSVQPTFMFCVGATKAGTSWLYEHLAAHPECHFRTTKELHYFTKTAAEHFDSGVVAGKREIAELKSWVASDWTVRRLADLRAWQKVLRLRKIEVTAYRDYLSDGLGSARLVGDLTPAYALMSEPQLRQLTTVGVDVRVVYLLRDPVERLWSHVRMLAKRAGAADFAGACFVQIERLLSGDLAGEGQGIAIRGDYAAILPKLARVFEPAKLLVQFSEDMMTVPGVARLSGFLGLTPLPMDTGRKVHEGKVLAMPPALHARAVAWLRPQYDYVASQFGDVPAAWRANMEKGFA